MKRNVYVLIALFVILFLHVPKGLSQSSEIIFGTSLNAKQQIKESSHLAKTLMSFHSSQWRAKGDQLRTYFFAEANENMPYRVCVPDGWDGKSKLPLVMFLHGGWNTESSYLDANDKQLVRLANNHGILLVSPLGCHASYGNSLVLPAEFGYPAETKKILSEVTDEKRKAQILSEKDVINVLELVLAEYPINRHAMFLTGHSMGGGGTWYIGAKYSGYWKALAPMSGPFVLKEGYPWKNIKNKPLFMSEGTKATASLKSSRELYEWLIQRHFNVKYKEVDADHPGMFPLILPDIFSFIDNCIYK